MSPDQIKQIEAIQQRIIQGNNELLSLLQNMNPLDQLVYSEKVKQNIIQSQNVFSGAKQLAGVATK